VKKSFDVDPINVDHNIKTGLKFLINNAGDLGADRIANTVAAHRLYKGNVIVVDFGTATTFCVVTEKGEYRGGAIMPGIAMSAYSLAEKTARLPLVELKAPDTILGKSTEDNILTGIILGHAGAVERIINEIKMDTGKDITVLATGGLVESVKSYIKAIDYVDPLLTLEGLRFIYELNS
jgi:type III pantothenate kinase